MEARKMFEVIKKANAADDYCYETLKAREGGIGSAYAYLMDLAVSELISKVLNICYYDDFFGSRKNKHGFLSDQAFNCTGEVAEFKDYVKRLKKLKKQCIKIRKSELKNAKK